MTAVGSATLVTRHVEEIVNGQCLDVIDEIYHPDLTFTDPFAPGGAAIGHDGLRRFLQAIYAAIPDFQFTVKHLFEDGEIGGWHGVVSGTLEHELAGIPGRGQRFAAPISEIFQLRDGRIAAVWVYLETATMLQQLGALPGTSD